MDYTYDEAGRQVWTGYFDKDDEPLELKKGYCEIRTEYDENGVKTDTYYNKSGNEVDVQ